MWVADIFVLGYLFILLCYNRIMQHFNIFSNAA